jgi:hypothetical protein
MRQFLLLAAIYSLVIHQSRKNSGKAVLPSMRPITKAAVLTAKARPNQNQGREFSYSKSEFTNSKIHAVSAIGKLRTIAMRDFIQ